MKISIGTLLLLSGLTLAVPIAAASVVVHQIDDSKQTITVELTEDQKAAVREEETKTPKTEEQETAVELQSTAPEQTIDLSGVDWVGLARSTYGRCGEYRDLALAVGWPAEQWPKLSKVMYRESRCNFDSFNRTDPNGGSRGLIQINGFWCRPSKYNPQGWLQAKGILNTCEDLFVPETNLRAGWAMWQYSQERNGCGWRPWSTSCR